MKRLALAIVFVLGFAPPVWADFQAGFAAYNRGDYATALREWKPLAEQGDASAQFNLGLMYRNGQGVPQDYAEAVKWYRRAAEQGDADAQFNLGIMYDHGKGVPQDYVQAHKWYNLAASRLPSGADRDLAVKNRDIVAPKMTAAQIAEVQRLARDWKPKTQAAPIYVFYIRLIWIWIEGHETLTSSIIGIFGVILLLLGVNWTIRANARLARDMRKDEIAKERRIIKVALLEELNVILTQIGYCKGLIVKKDQNGFKSIDKFPIHRENLVFESSSEKLGLLSDNQIRSVMGMYCYHREFYTRLYIMIDAVPDNPFYVRVSGPDVGRLSHILNQLERHAKRAHRALSVGETVC